MTLRLLGHTQWIALIAACATSACGSSKPPPPDAFIAASVLDTSTGSCNFHSATVIVDIGEPLGDNKPATVSNGGNEMGGESVTVECAVTASGSGFSVQLTAEQKGTGGGSLSISSPPGQPLDPVNGGTVSATWTNVNVGAYQQDGCTVTYSYQGGAVPSSAGPPIAAGRIWAHVSCPMATDDQQMPEPVCDGEADILFENCSQ